MSKVEEAIKKYDSYDWKALWDVVSSNEAVEELVLNERKALLKVQAAFYEATRDRNSLATCTQCPLDDLRFFVRRWKDPP
jgi:hypothetical protein